MNLKQVVEQACKEKVLVIKHDDTFTKNPTFEAAKKIISKALDITFMKKIKAEGRGPYRYVLQFHVRGRSVHIDFRFQIGNRRVTGYTVATPMSLSAETHKRISDKAESIVGEDVGSWSNVSDSKKREVVRKIDVPEKAFKEEFEEKFTGFIRNWNKKNIVELKSEQDESWFQESYRIIPPGFIGATKEEWAALVPFDEGVIEFGTMKSDYHEMWLKSDKGIYTGRVVITWLPRDQVQKKDDTSSLGSKAWVGFLFSSKTTEPYILSSRAIKEEFMPPSGESYLPSSFERIVPEDLKFWKLKDKKEKRKELAEWCKDNIEFYERKDEKDVPPKDKLWVKA